MDKKILHDPRFITMVVGIVFTLIIIGGVILFGNIAKWGRTHQIVKQRVIKVETAWPIRIEEIEPQKEILIPAKPFEELSTTEQKIIEVWKDYRTAMLAITIFECESGFNAQAVSATGDLGVAQINWPTWKDKVFEEFGYTAIDMFDVDKNLEVAYWIWDRADGVIDGEGSFEPWSVYNSGAYIDCL